MTRPGWLEDASGRVTANAVTHSDANGLWRLDLISTAEFQVDACYRIVETCTGDVWFIQMPDPTPPDAEYWMRDLLVMPPSEKDCGYRLINRLAQLADIDRSSIATAKPGDVLTLLPSGKWGASGDVPPPPPPLKVDWQPVVDDLLSITATVAGAGASGARLAWGDSAEQVVTGTDPVAHTYAPGTYTVTATDVVQPTRQATATVTVKDHAPIVHAFADPDDDWRVLVWVHEHNDGTAYEIDFGDGTAHQIIQGDPPPYPRVMHEYTALGTYTITVLDTATRRSTTVSFECGRFGVLFQFHNDHTPQVHAARLRAGATWEVDWGDGTPAVRGTVSAVAQMVTARDAAMEPGTYAVAVREIVDGTVRREEKRDLVIPNMFNMNIRVGMDWTHQTTPKVLVTPMDTLADQTCTVDWGDGSPTEQVAGHTQISHVYASIPPEGWMLRVTEDAGLLRRFTRLLAAPASVSEPILASWAPRAVDLHVQGAQGRTNADWYLVTWGDGTTHLFGAVGASSTAGHAYFAPGEYTITLDSPGMPEPITRRVVVPNYPPHPTVWAGQDTTDPQAMTALINVDNSTCGGPVTITIEDGTVLSGPEVGEVPHTFAEPGTYWVLVTCDADPTARDLITVTVPFGPVRTLVAEIGPDPSGDQMSARVTVTAHTPGRALAVDWAEGDGWEAMASTQATHRFDFDGEYRVRVSYQDDQTEIVKLPITIPWSQEEPSWPTPY